MTCWQLGNTTVRSALRLRDGLRAYSESDIQGDIRGGAGDKAFRQLLGEVGLVSLGEDSTQSVGRKWRSALGKMGFIFPEVKRQDGFSQDELGPCDYLTPAGRSLLQATTMPAIYESFLRAMAVPLHVANDQRYFSPLRWTFAILLTLAEQGEENAYLSFSEFAAYVQTTDPTWGRSEVAALVMESRNRRREAPSARNYKRELLAEAERTSGYKKGTLRDYADENIRYLKATGVLQSCGRGIRIVPEKRYIARTLSEADTYDISLLEMLRQQCAGAELPTDSMSVAEEALLKLVESAREFGIHYQLGDVDFGSVSSINNARYAVEELIDHERELRYAARQAGELPITLEYLSLLSEGKGSKKLGDGTVITIPSDERPAYFEWAVWRALLAIDSLSNPPYEVRRFKIDSDFMPVSTASGGGADLVAEFDDCIVAAEVTLSTSSRQEAMEGEPVRRHVADLALATQKPVYGLFIAVDVNLNTVETFRHGLWYAADEQLLSLSIVPLSLCQFATVLSFLFSGDGELPARRLRRVLDFCLALKKGASAPIWRDLLDASINSGDLMKALGGSAT
ncbi:AlwI family type II restriction endonuclease [uncultured Adlercreutzia sp.]|uniref:AlwI family type II restriction endonuclease n=1 Tax=uncultured Adlercreutzia sp. TaxID=875803 RepID=UPI0026F38F75|nr:AlwI family type II restriction endonuclease [uncultured Adlercreutzia sp.]